MWACASITGTTWLPSLDGYVTWRSPRAVSEQARRPDQQDDNQQSVDLGGRPDRESVLRVERGCDSDDHGAEHSALDPAQAADDGGEERVDGQTGAHEGADREQRQDKSAAEAGQRAGDHQNLEVDAPDVDSHERGRLTVLDAGPYHPSERSLDVQQ